ncbi:phosphoadenosine phosphosulfate reductase family protein [Parasutterella sp.]|uniref:phosphoadenosine phosphosulfate reductase domain-containing protein n=1 Tax=Parasutterella sp. TaxID=2049037 RepID=UPI003AF1B0FC
MDHHVLGISGGKDSAALALYMQINHPELDIQYFFTDTGKELPEVYEFLDLLEARLGKKILRLTTFKTFDYYLKMFNNYLPSPQTRWCTRMMKLRPFQEWIKPWLDNGEDVYSYVAIRADEPHRTGLTQQHPHLHVTLPFREEGIKKPDVKEILENSGIGLPKYYEWRSRSGCTFCFFQQKIEWVHLLERHPEAFDEAMHYEKDALEHGSPFTWTQGEPLQELKKPQRIIQIKQEFEKRKQRELARRRKNPLRDGLEDLSIDDIYDADEGNGACIVCAK